MPLSRATATLLLAGSIFSLAAAAHAQDSVSTTNGLPGDAPSAYQVTSGDSRQVLRYVVDLTPKQSSWAGQFAIAPVVKASASNAGGYFDQLMGAQCASSRFGSGCFASSRFVSSRFASSRFVSGWLASSRFPSSRRVSSGCRGSAAGCTGTA